METQQQQDEGSMLAIQDIVNFVATLNTRVELGLSESINVFDYSPVLAEDDTETGSFWFNYTDMLTQATNEGTPRLETIKGLVIHGQVLKGLTGDITAGLPESLQGIHNIGHVVTDDPASLGFRLIEEAE